MIVLLVVGVLVLTVLALAWLTRDRELPVKCCDPAPWPPADIDRRHAERDDAPADAARPA